MAETTPEPVAIKEPELDEYPRWWNWDEDGDLVEGLFLRAGRGYTEQGQRPFVVLDVAGEERTVWLHQAVLQSIFAREVHRRPSKRIEVGERVQLRRLSERESRNGRTYIDFKARFPDGPEPSQVDIFGAPSEPSGVEAPNDVAIDAAATAEDAEATPKGPGDEIPF